MSASSADPIKSLIQEDDVYKGEDGLVFNPFNPSNFSQKEFPKRPMPSPL